MVSVQEKASQLSKLTTADGGMYAGHDEFYQQQSDGTTIIAIKYDGGILLGADGRTSNVSSTLSKGGVKETCSDCINQRIDKSHACFE